MNTLIGDPARTDEVQHYIETTVRPHVEAQAGCRGLATLSNRDLGVTLVASYWDSAESMALSEHAVETSRKEAAELAQGMVSVDHFEVPVFARRSRPGPGAGIRMTAIDCPPEEVPAAIEAFRENALPRLLETDGLCSVQLLADAGILVAPGEFYGPAGRSHVRVALTATDERIGAASTRLAALA